MRARKILTLTTVSTMIAGLYCDHTAGDCCAGMFCSK